MEGVFRFKSWFLNTLGLIHGGAYTQWGLLSEFYGITDHASLPIYINDTNNTLSGPLVFRAVAGPRYFARSAKSRDIDKKEFREIQ